MVAAYYETRELVGVDMSLDGPCRSSFRCEKCQARVSVQRRFESRKIKCPIDGAVMTPPRWRRKELRFRDEDVDRFLEERFRQSAIAAAREAVQRPN
jgi:hypothetical protein